MFRGVKIKGSEEIIDDGFPLPSFGRKSEQKSI